MSFNNFLYGSKGKFGSQPTLLPEQQNLLMQLINMLQGGQSEGVYGNIIDYYKDLLSPDSQTAQEMFAPEMRRFNEEIIPDLAEQFAGMGSGALSSSGFRNASVSAGKDLSERLGAIRAGLKQQGAAGLSGLTQPAFGQYKENYYMPGQPGALHGFSQGLGQSLPYLAMAGLGI